MTPNADFFCLDFNDGDDFSTMMNLGEFNVVQFFAMWDYFTIPERAVTLLKKLTKGVLFFEGHADGERRMEHDITENGRVHKSWRHILEDELQTDYTLLGMTDNGRRPFYRCEF